MCFHLVLDVSPAWRPRCCVLTGSVCSNGTETRRALPCFEVVLAWGCQLEERGGCGGLNCSGGVERKKKKSGIQIITGLFSCSPRVFPDRWATWWSLERHLCKQGSNPVPRICMLCTESVEVREGGREGAGGGHLHGRSSGGTCWQSWAGVLHWFMRTNGEQCAYPASPPLTAH